MIEVVAVTLEGQLVDPLSNKPEQQLLTLIIEKLVLFTLENSNT